MTHELRLRDWSAGWPAGPVFQGWNLSVGRGEVVAVIGTNGVGKTTLLRSLVGAARCYSGQLLADGRPVAPSAPGSSKTSTSLAYVPEGRAIFARLTVLENMLVGAARVRPHRQKELLEESLTLFPALKALLSSRGGVLSGGEQQMLAIARGLMADPEFLLLDEPTIGLAPVMLDRIIDAIRGFKERIGLLVAEQNLPFTLRVADRGYMAAADGTLREVAITDRDFAAEATRAYLGVAVASPPAMR